MPSWTRTLGASGALAICLLAASPIQSVAEDTRSRQNVFIMGGPFSHGSFGDTFQVWRDHYETNRFVGAGYQHFFYDYGALQLGVEAGLGVRIGAPTSLEAWAGLATRLTEFEVGPVNITPSVTAGFSAVTDTIGVETKRSVENNQPAGILFYLAPEIGISHDDMPELELFGRIQHRSGGFGVIAEIDGSNAATLGVRYKF
jgi:hypothetical protein